MNNKRLRTARLGMAGAALAAAFGGLLSLGAAAVVASSPAGAVVTPTAPGSLYIPLASPSRIADTRAASTLLPDHGMTLHAQGTVVVNLPGVPTDANAVVLNVTEVNATAPSFFTVYPTGDTSSNFSNLNFVPGPALPNLVVVPITSGGSVSIYNWAGTADAIVDLEGYYETPSGTNLPLVTASPGQFFPITPVRVTDTRTGSAEPNAGQTLGANTTLPVTVTGAGGTGGVPTTATNVSAVELNVTVTNTTGASYLTVFPGGTTQPVASNLNWNTGTVIANRVIVPVSSAGIVDIYNYFGNADVVVDVDGWYSGGTGNTVTGGSAYVPIAPLRITDTRSTSVPAEPNAGKTLITNSAVQVQVAGVDSIPSTITGAVLNVTEAASSGGGFLTVFPGTLAYTPPKASDLNFVPGEVIANADEVGVGTAGTATGSVDVYNWSGNTDVVVDLFGYFVPAVAAAT
jgi:hypothetical protein